MNRILYRTAAISALLIAAACNGEKKESEEHQAEKSPPAVSGAGFSDVKPTGRNIVVELYTDEKGNYFKPAKFEVHRGDKITFTLMSGVHNVHFLSDSNPGKQGLPAPSEFLQLPGQTYELIVSLAPGKYFFQCDPHALLGMVGRIEVEDDND
jgi:plastocyanin